jgi:hypothetical protein
MATGPWPSRICGITEFGKFYDLVYSSSASVHLSSGLRYSNFFIHQLEFLLWIFLASLALYCFSLLLLLRSCCLVIIIRSVLSPRFFQNFSNQTQFLPSPEFM